MILQILCLNSHIDLPILQIGSYIPFDNNEYVSWGKNSKTMFDFGQFALIY